MDIIIWLIAAVVIGIVIVFGEVALMLWTINKVYSCTEEEYERVIKPFYEKYKYAFPPECQLRAACRGGYGREYDPSTKSEEELRADLIYGIKCHIIEFSDLFYQGHLRAPTDEELAQSMTFDAEQSLKSCGYSNICCGCDKKHQ